MSENREEEVKDDGKEPRITPRSNNPGNKAKRW
jgi:hypothetical protein